jgi:hypothetical protein
MSGEFACKFVAGKDEPLSQFGSELAEASTLSLRKDGTAAMYSGNLRYFGSWKRDANMIIISWEREISGLRKHSATRSERLTIVSRDLLRLLGSGTDSNETTFQRIM